MNNHKMDEMLGRALRDKEFRQRLTANPRTVALEEGLAAEEVEAIAGGMSISSVGKVAFCTAKTCYQF